MIPPLRTEATTAALRRTTHLLVLGGRNSSMSRGPGHRITRRRFHRVPPSSLGHPSHQQDPPVTELAGKTAACSRAAARRSRLLAAGPFISRSFTLSSVLSSTFSTFESGASVCKCWCLKAWPESRPRVGSVRQGSCRRRERPVANSVFTFFYAEPSLFHVRFLRPARISPSFNEGNFALP